MAHGYPVWIDVDSCIYRSDKSYGVRRDGVQRIYVGTSAKNSHPFATIYIKVRDTDSGGKRYALYVDGIKVKEATVTSKEYEETYNALCAIAPVYESA